MPFRYYGLEVTTNPQTLASNPLNTSWPLEFAKLVSIEIDVPAGHNGLTGIRFNRSKQQVIPVGNNSFLRLNDRMITVSVDEELTEGGLQVVTYNNDNYIHTHFLRATIANLDAQGQAGPLPTPIIASALLTSAAVPST